MTFSSPGFLFFFMPLVFMLYFAMPKGSRNAFLMLASFAFYFVDAGFVTAVLLGSVILNAVVGNALHATPPGKRAHLILTFGVIANLAPLVYYKYWNFLQGAAADAVGASWTPSAIVLPAGISFFTFQGISYIVDIYRRHSNPAPGPVGFGMYHSLFPQLIAGPIVRYVEVAHEITDRPIRLVDVHEGLIRFCVGLAKKMIIGDNVGMIADRMFGVPANELTMAAAWVGILAYTLQIFFDFSGYSDMAIGMGRMLGFKFPENFDQPYRSQSITEFWRRWHMTLSRWFRDYVYIPLGGNRAGPINTYLNLLIVFTLCGLWHGAAYTFLIWGLFHGALLVIERVAKNRFNLVPHGLSGWAVTFVLVMIGWVFFRAQSAHGAMQYLAAMAGLSSAPTIEDVWNVVTPDKALCLCLGTVIALLPPRLDHGLWATERRPFAGPLLSAGALVLFAYSAVLIAANGFNPFIYFRF
ncbi:MBOAT family protein [Variovorax sp. Sphag1AA]|uniref:MBOAT family O-acyltransferase n=1 Tax=Variovorax sp. Sphag1AA TaxID=2587027 RepID=UPI0016093D99|nr:MBOAT family protein [Variovorax sp. Sphag1AA]MBB3179826.1 alginate O-acetyltransferase complex protein AlgI [Variovorax sp. Sphag1AA]